jgi:type III secretion system (T3SS) SseB-like protein
MNKTKMPLAAVCMTVILMAAQPSAAAQAAQGQAPMAAKLDLNKPVVNAELSLAMDRLARDTSDAAKDALLLELNKANYLAVSVGKGLSEGIASSNGQALLPAGARFDLLMAGKQGKNYLLLFTDWDAIRAYTKEDVTAIVLPAKDAWSFFSSTLAATYEGIVINPAHNALPLRKPMISYLAAASSKAERK